MKPGKSRSGARGPAFYDKAYETDPKNAYGCEWRESPYAPAWRWIAQKLVERDLVQSRILELGCGPGQLASCLKDHGARKYMGVDFSERAIAMTPFVPGFKFLVGDVSDPRCKCWRFNYSVVVSTEVLEHLDDDLALMEMIKPGTFVVVSVPCHDSESHVRYFEDEIDAVGRYSRNLWDVQSTRIGKIVLICGTKG